MICDISVYNPRIFCAGIGVLCSLGTDGLGDTTKYQIFRDLVVINILPGTYLSEKSQKCGKM